MRLDSGRLDARNLDAWLWENRTLGLWTLGPKKFKLHFTIKGAVTDMIFLKVIFSFPKNESTFARIWQTRGFVERLTSVKMNLIVFKESVLK